MFYLFFRIIGSFINLNLLVIYMFKISKVEESSFYIDQAMKSMQEYATKEREKIGERFEKSIGTFRKDLNDVNINKRKDLELQKIRFLNDRLNDSLKKIIKSFPNLSKTQEIYLNLINTSDVNVAEIKDALARLLWIVNTIDEFTQTTESKLKKTKTQATIGFLMKKYLGKVNSLFYKNKTFFRRLDEARKFINKLPTFEDLHTIAIAGFPNVGKSTLMKKMTGSNVEIQDYPFTTKGLMFGYIKENNIKYIQFIDTPGLLGRDKNNGIEQRAEVIITKYAASIIFVIDFTESCGYSVESQMKLLKKTQEVQPNIVIYLSKTDIYNEENEDIRKQNEVKLKKYQIFTDSDILRKYCLDEQKKTIKFDPTKLKVIR